MCSPTNTAPPPATNTQPSHQSISLPTTRQCLRIVAAVSAVALTVLATAAFITTGAPGALAALVCFSIIAIAICTPYSAIGRIHMHCRPWGRPGIVVHTAPRPWWRPAFHIQRPARPPVRVIHHHHRTPPPRVAHVHHRAPHVNHHQRVPMADHRRR